ncbi:putative golgin subfamily A member 6-like protein 3 [Sorghum bicolor]|uniref:putative golgin subfamily A member 6-like protein 3 n=1 Tax=Sorghum bicolor TaxID=4558 RepID=UPI000B424221|nr:putative golgin subfamily A member 6-like protein 3 [Sorghum bicolor]|eukprot:XP_021306284.1 putative golgin subfamily A member 6-like protein 3 [Sorghum bicolor]
MPHWDLWLHLYRGELFNAPGGSAGVRKPVRAGCLNLVLKTRKSERPHEYIPDLEACRMSNKAPADDEVAARVRAAVAGDFQPKHVNGFPMRPDVGSIGLGSIDVRSSSPPVKEDEVDRDKRRESAKKQKSTMDLKKKKEKKKNLERQALETRRAKSRQRGEPEEESPNEDDSGDGDDDSDDSEGMGSRLDRILEGSPRTDVDPVGLRSVEEQRKREEEERVQETWQQLQEGQQRPQQKEGQEGQQPEGPQLEELLEQDRQQELRELQEQQQRRGQQLKELLEPPSHRAAASATSAARAWKRGGESAGLWSSDPGVAPSGSAGFYPS